MKNIFCILGLSSLAIIFSGCGLDLSRQMDYDSDRNVENKSPSSGGKENHWHDGYGLDPAIEENTVADPNEERNTKAAPNRDF